MFSDLDYLIHCRKRYLLVAVERREETLKPQTMSGSGSGSGGTTPRERGGSGSPSKEEVEKEKEMPKESATAAGSEIENENPYFLALKKKLRNTRKKLKKIVEIEAMENPNEEQLMTVSTKPGVLKSLQDLEGVWVAMEQVAAEQVVEEEEAREIHRVEEEKRVAETEASHAKMKSKLDAERKKNRTLQKEMKRKEQEWKEAMDEKQAQLEALQAAAAEAKENEAERSTTGTQCTPSPAVDVEVCVLRLLNLFHLPRFSSARNQLVPTSMRTVLSFLTDVVIGNTLPPPPEEPDLGLARSRALEVAMKYVLSSSDKFSATSDVTYSDIEGGVTKVIERLVAPPLSSQPHPPPQLQHQHQPHPPLQPQPQPQPQLPSLSKPPLTDYDEAILTSLPVNGHAHQEQEQEQEKPHDDPQWGRGGNENAAGWGGRAPVEDEENKEAVRSRGKKRGGKNRVRSNRRSVPACDK